MKRKPRRGEPAASAPPAAEREPAPPPSARDEEPAQLAETLAEIEARAAAAHARELAEAEALVEAHTSTESAASVDIEAPSPALLASRLASARPYAPDDDDEDDEDAYDDRWDDEEYAHHRGPRRPLRERARGRLGTAELLMFRIARERFAVELACVEEAIDLPEVHHVPEMPPAMLGVISVRGALTPVFTPEEALGVPVEGRTAALVFRAASGRFALAIDDVDDVLSLDLATLRDAPGVDGSDSVVLGVALHAGAIVALVDAEMLIESCQAIPVPELA
jgi:chemotaxis signal transduction protein